MHGRVMTVPLDLPILSLLLLNQGYSNVAWKIPEILETYANAPAELLFVSVAGSTRFGVYGLDFGWGKPVKVSIDQISMTEQRRKWWRGGWLVAQETRNECFDWFAS
ncbi:unnamed protein product [Microthlaspi erraticum]|uniref:Uncharacterized protein n=1 Tax=Microthlaspi erraticum TaxID=1685480 RepID=A0A6D2KQ98_9BRAS|nr:unnamed protein product [Microthlaspi erraticum]